MDCTNGLLLTYLRTFTYFVKMVLSSWGAWRMSATLGSRQTTRSSPGLPRASLVWIR